LLDRLHRRLGGRGPVQGLDETQYTSKPATP